MTSYLKKKTFFLFHFKIVERPFKYNSNPKYYPADVSENMMIKMFLN